MMPDSSGSCLTPWLSERETDAGIGSYQTSSQGQGEVSETDRGQQTSRRVLGDSRVGKSTCSVRAHEGLRLNSELTVQLGVAVPGTPEWRWGQVNPQSLLGS